MHWLTAIFGLVSGYTLAGFIYTLARSGEKDSLLFFGIGFVLFVFLTVANEMRARHKKLKPDAHPAQDRPNQAWP